MYDAVDKETCENIINAVIVQAARDYQNAYKAHRKNPNNQNAKIRLEELRTFFRSEVFKSLTYVDGEYIMKKIEDNCKKNSSWQIYRKRKEWL